MVLYTREQFNDITRLATWSAAAYDGRIRVPLGAALEQRDELDRVLSHEFVHAVVAMIRGPHRARMGERGARHGARTSGPPRMRKRRWRAPTRGRHSRTLHRSFVGFSRRDAEIAYASAARAVRRLIAAAWRGGRRRAAGGSATRRAVCQRVPAANRDALRGFRGARRARLSGRRH